MKMSYFVVGTNDRPIAVSFYNALFAECGINHLHSSDRMTFWAGADCMFAVAEPYDGNPATIGNGSMVGFQMDSAERVDALHAEAIILGGIDEGEPKIRSDRYSAYVRDLDGNKLCFFE